MKAKRTPVTFHDFLNTLSEPVRTRALRWIEKTGVEVCLVPPRKAKYGDYRYPLFGKTARITLNNNLDSQMTLLVFCHEMAHAVVFYKLGKTDRPHGKEWKHYYRILINRMVDLQAFDPDVSREITSGPYKNSSAGIHRVFMKRLEKEGFVSVKSLPVGARFHYGRNRTFIRGESLKKRIKGAEEKTGRLYLFDPLCIVKPH